MQTLMMVSVVLERILYFLWTIISTVVHLLGNQKKIKRIVRSTIASEVLSLQEAIEHAIILRSFIEILLLPLKSIPIDAIIDNKSVVEVA